MTIGYALLLMVQQSNITRHTVFLYNVVLVAIINFDSGYFSTQFKPNMLARM